MGEVDTSTVQAGFGGQMAAEEAQRYFDITQALGGAVSQQITKLRAGNGGGARAWPE